MSSGKAIAKVSAAIARLRKMTNWLRKASDTLELSDQFKKCCPSLRFLCLASIVAYWEAGELFPQGLSRSL